MKTTLVIFLLALLLSGCERPEYDPGDNFRYIVQHSLDSTFTSNVINDTVYDTETYDNIYYIDLYIAKTNFAKFINESVHDLKLATNLGYFSRVIGVYKTSYIFYKSPVRSYRGR